MVERFERFSHAIFEISRCWHKLASEEMEAYGLKGPYAVYLMAILRSPEGITSAQLCDLSGRDKADVSRAISVMEQKGLIKREGEGSKLYRARLILTPQGQEAARQVSRRASMAVECAGQGYSEEQREIFWQVLDTIAGNLQDMTKTGIPRNKE